jgi:hypothetical protein
MPSVEEIQKIFEAFQKNFESVTLTLIASMNKISENLSRIGEAMELTDKINIQNVENKQLLNQMDRQMKSLLGRLERMSKGGFELPELPPEPAEQDVESLLSASYTPSGAATSSEQSEEKSSEPVVNSNLDTEISNDPSPNPTNDESFDALLESISGSSNPPQPESNSPIETIPPIPPNPVLEQKNQENSQLSKDQPSAWDEGLETTNSPIPNPSTPKEFLQNLILDVEKAATIDEVGNLILQMKEHLSKLVPFNGSYFEMVMYSGPKRSQKGVPNNPTIIQEAKQKIQGWIAKF